jgi:hypothetical protein
MTDLTAVDGGNVLKCVHIRALLPWFDATRLYQRGNLNLGRQTRRQGLRMHCPCHMRIPSKAANHETTPELNCRRDLRNPDKMSSHMNRPHHWWPLSFPKRNHSLSKDEPPD